MSCSDQEAQDAMQPSLDEVTAVNTLLNLSNPNSSTNLMISPTTGQVFQNSEPISVQHQQNSAYIYVFYCWKIKRDYFFQMTFEINILLWRFWMTKLPK